jgi:hypothetical protein
MLKSPFESGPDNQASGVRLVENDAEEAENLEFEMLTNKKHEGITRNNREKYIYLMGRLDELGKMPDNLRPGNEINIVRASIQNLITRERLLQEAGSTSLGSDYFLNLVPKKFKKTAEDFFDDSRGGITTATVAIDRDLRRDDGIIDKQIFFNNKLDAEYDTDYILLGRRFDKSGEEELIAKFVQAGTSMKYKSREDVTEAHNKLAKNLRTEVAHPETFEEAEERIEDTLAEFIQNLDRLKHADEPLPGLEEGARFAVETIGEDVFSRKTLAAVENLREAQDPCDYVPQGEFSQFRKAVYGFKLLTEHLENSDGHQIKDIIDRVFADAATQGLNWVEEVSSDYIKDIKQSLGQVMAVFLRELKELDLLEEVAYSLKSRMMIKHKGEDEDRPTLTGDEVEMDIKVDNTLPVMYRIRKQALSKLLKQL